MRNKFYTHSLPCQPEEEHLKNEVEMVGLFFWSP